LIARVYEVNFYFIFLNDSDVHNSLQR